MSTPTQPVPDTQITPGTGVDAYLEGLFHEELPPCQVRIVTTCKAGHIHDDHLCGQPSVAVMTVHCATHGTVANISVCADCRDGYQATPDQWACDVSGCGERVKMTFS